tara:strand:+ start:601 stop:1005 length:405 start_codon:yes stop_codon:yes gene_type:complete
VRHGLAFLAYMIASYAVALVWGTSVVLVNGLARQETFWMQIVPIFALIAFVVAIPVLAVYVIAVNRNAVSYRFSAVAGMAIGIGLFLLFFISWTSGFNLAEFGELAFYGGGLGLVGGVVFMATRRVLFRLVGQV